MLEVSNLGYETPAVVQYQRSTVIVTEFALLIVVWIVSRCAWVYVMMACGWYSEELVPGHLHCLQAITHLASSRSPQS